MKDNGTFTMTDANGKITTYSVLFTFESDETKKNYIVYTDEKKDSKGDVQVYASTYDPNNPQTKLEAIETEKEWKVIQAILDTLQEEIKKSDKGSEQ